MSTVHSWADVVRYIAPAPGARQPDVAVGGTGEGPGAKKGEVGAPKPIPPTDLFGGMKMPESSSRPTGDVVRPHPLLQGLGRVAAFKPSFAVQTRVSSAADQGGNALIHELSWRGRPVGGMNMTTPASPSRGIRDYFAGVLRPGDTVSKHYGIHINPEYEGRSRGHAALARLILLGSLHHHSADWYTSSSAEPLEVVAMRGLQRMGLIELHWAPGQEPDRHGYGGDHLLRMTPRGRAEYRRLIALPPGRPKPRGGEQLRRHSWADVVRYAVPGEGPLSPPPGSPVGDTVQPSTTPSYPGGPMRRNPLVGEVAKPHVVHPHLRHDLEPLGIDVPTVAQLHDVAGVRDLYHAIERVRGKDYDDPEDWFPERRLTPLTQEQRRQLRQHQTWLWHWLDHLQAAAEAPGTELIPRPPPHTEQVQGREGYRRGHSWADVVRYAPEPTGQPPETPRPAQPPASAKPKAPPAAVAPQAPAMSAGLRQALAHLRNFRSTVQHPYPSMSLPHGHPYQDDADVLTVLATRGLPHRKPAAVAEEMDQLGPLGREALKHLRRVPGYAVKVIRNPYSIEDQFGTGRGHAVLAGLAPHVEELARDWAIEDDDGPTEEGARRHGQLLGYTPEAIEDFIRRGRQQHGEEPDLDTPARAYKESPENVRESLRTRLALDDVRRSRQYQNLLQSRGSEAAEEWLLDVLDDVIARADKRYGPDWHRRADRQRGRWGYERRHSWAEAIRYTLGDEPAPRTPPSPRSGNYTTVPGQAPQTPVPKLPPHPRLAHAGLAGGGLVHPPLMHDPQYHEWKKAQQERRDAERDWLGDAGQRLAEEQQHPKVEMGGLQHGTLVERDEAERHAESPDLVGHPVARHNAAVTRMVEEARRMQEPADFGPPNERQRPESTAALFALADQVNERPDLPLTPQAISDALGVIDTAYRDPDNSAVGEGLKRAREILAEKQRRSDKQKQIRVHDVDKFLGHFGANRGDWQTRLAARDVPYEQADLVPVPGERVYFKDREGKIIATGVVPDEGGVTDTGRGYRVHYDVTRHEGEGAGPHARHEEDAYRQGYKSALNTPPRGLDSSLAVRRAIHEREQEHLEEVEALDPAERRLFRHGQRDAEQGRDFGHAVEGLRPRNREEADRARDLWANHMARKLQEPGAPLRQVLKEAGIPTDLLAIGHQAEQDEPFDLVEIHPGVWSRRPLWNESGRVSLDEQTGVPHVPHPVLHHLLDAIYPHWQHHLRKGGRGGLDEFKAVAHRALDRLFPVDEHPYDVLRQHVRGQGNPYGADFRDSYRPSQARYRAREARQASTDEMLEMGYPLFATARALREGGHRAGMAASDGDPRILDLGREVLRRDKLWQSLPGVVRRLAEQHSGGWPDSQNLSRALKEGAIPREVIDRVNRAVYDPHMLARYVETDPGRWFAHALRGLHQVADAFARHAGPRPERLGRHSWAEVVRYALGDDAPAPAPQPSPSPTPASASTPPAAPQAKALRFRPAPEDEYGPGHWHLHLGDEKIGRISASRGSDFRTADGMFPRKLQPGDTVLRLGGIDVPDKAHRGRGFGKLMYLALLAKQKEPLRTWVYNSQTEPGATNAYLSLARDGLMEVHWRGTPRYGRPGGVHLARLTPRGLDVIRNRPETLIRPRAIHPPAPDAFDSLGYRRHSWAAVIRYAAEGETAPTPSGEPPTPPPPPAPAPAPTAPPRTSLPRQELRGTPAPAEPWQQPVPVEHLDNAGVTPFRGAGLSSQSGDSHILDLQGRKYFAKRPADRHTGRLNQADLDTELVAHRILHLAGIPGVPQAGQWDRGPDHKYVVTPLLPGESGNDVVRRLTGEDVNAASPETKERLYGSPALRAELKRLVQSVPPEHLGAVAFGTWLVNGGDRHSNNYLYRQGTVHPIDWGHSVFPRDARREMHWDGWDGLFANGGFTHREFARLPVPRRVAEQALRKEKAILSLVRGLKPHYANEGAYSWRKMVRHFEDKFALLKQILAEKPGSLKLGDFSIIGNTPSPAR